MERPAAAAGRLGGTARTAGPVAAAVVAAAANEVIGRSGELPWYLPGDLRRFRDLTRGHVVVMGRVTYESILARLGRPLPDRVSVVISHHPHPAPAPAAPPAETPPPQDQPGQAQQSKDQLVQARPRQDQPSRDQPTQDLVARDQPRRGQAGQDQPGEDLVARDQPGPDLVAHDQPGRRQPGEDLGKRGQPGQDQAGQDQVRLSPEGPPGRGYRTQVRYQPSVSAALRDAAGLAAAAGDPEFFVIGGASVYEQTLPDLRRVYLTRVHQDVPGDRYLPAGWLDGFELTGREPGDAGEGTLPYSYLCYERPVS